MAERTIERRREPEPTETMYDQMRSYDNERLKQRLQGKVVIKGKDIPWEQGRHGLLKIFVWEKNWGEVGAFGWRLFINHIKKHGGKHIHQGGTPLFVLQ